MTRRMVAQSSQTKEGKAFKMICAKFQLDLIRWYKPTTLISAGFFKLEKKKFDYEMWCVNFKSVKYDMDLEVKVVFNPDLKQTKCVASLTKFSLLKPYILYFHYTTV